MRNVGVVVLAGAAAVAGLSLLAWLLGLVTGFTGGGLIHLLLVLAILVGPAGMLTGVVLIIAGGGRNRRR